MATTDLILLVYSNMEEPEVVKRAYTIEEAVQLLMLTTSGGVRITGTWRAGGKRGELELVYVRLISPTATHMFVSRFLQESIRLHIAKELMRSKNPGFELTDRAG